MNNTISSTYFHIVYYIHFLSVITCKVIKTAIILQQKQGAKTRFF